MKIYWVWITAIKLFPESIGAFFNARMASYLLSIIKFSLNCVMIKMIYHRWGLDYSYLSYSAMASWITNNSLDKLLQDFAFLRNFLKLITLYVVSFCMYFVVPYLSVNLDRLVILIPLCYMQPRSCSRAMGAIGVVEASCEEIFELVMNMDSTRFEWVFSLLTFE